MQIAKCRLLAAALLAGLVTVGSGVSAHGDEPAGSAKPYGIARRTLWTTSRVVGAPDPPPPYRAVAAFAGLTFEHPVYLRQEPGGDDFLMVLQDGKVLRFPNDPDVKETDTFLEIEDHDTYSLCFDPQYAENHHVYVFANGPRSSKKRKNRILRYEVRREPMLACDPKTEHVVIEWESNGHNGGEMDFGPDGRLYISSGDGTSDSDGDLTGQDITDLTSGVLRIDVRRPDPGRGYSIPSDNPFLNIEGARGELWAYGFRNPWRMTFDAKTGDLWVGDIGQDQWEMVTRVERGANYGWSVHEGSHPFYLERKRGPTPISPPTIEHPHSEARSITGGLVYDGPRFAGLRGAYIYGDYSTGKVWGVRYEDNRIVWRRELADTSAQILGFATDKAGEIYLVDYGGSLLKMEPAPAAEATNDFPRKLSETGLFLSTAEYRLQGAVIPYSVNAPLWSDGAVKDRYIALPGESLIEFTQRGAWKFPENAVLVKTFSLEAPGSLKAPRSLGAAGGPRRIETRLMHLYQGEWRGYSYLWNDAQTDADLVEAAGVEREYAVRDPDAPGGVRRQRWRFPSRAECMMCHSRAAGYLLGLSTPQMNKEHDYGAVTDQQLRTLEHLEVFGRKKTVKLDDGTSTTQIVAAKLPGPIDQLPRLPNPFDPAADLDERARAYLHANCAHCHVEAGGGNSQFNVRFDTAEDKQNLIDEEPHHHRFGMKNARLVAPGDPKQSVLHHRVATRDRGFMPPLGTTLVDRRAAKLLAEWIRKMKAKPVAAPPVESDDAGGKRRKPIGKSKKP